MEKITICTDCTGIKQSAIQAIFDFHFQENENQILLLKNKTFQTPLEYDDFYSIIGNRILTIQNSLPGEAYCASIQKGYYKLGLQWQLSAIVSLRSPKGRQIEAFAATVPTTKRSSRLKTEDPSRNFSDLFAEEFPKWNKKDSVYTLLTGYSEKRWLQEPLGYCMNFLLK